MSATPDLNSCGCCAGEPELETITNRPGLNALAYRMGTYGEFLQRLLDQIRSASIADGPNQGAQPLAGLTTRSLDDPSIALLDAWAIVADVLTFYQERIANEGFLRTATERRSILELARAIGYELNPGVAASAYLQFTVEEIIGTAAATGATPGLRTPVPPGPGSSAFNSGIVDIPQGTQVQSVPAPGKLPQTFETTADFRAHAKWNQLSPRLSRRADLALSNGQLYLIGDSSSFQPGTFTFILQSSVFLVNPLAPEPSSFQGLFAHGLLNLFKGKVLSSPVKSSLGSFVLASKSFAVSSALKSIGPIKAASSASAASETLKLNPDLLAASATPETLKLNPGLLTATKVSETLKLNPNLLTTSKALDTFKLNPDLLLGLDTSLITLQPPLIDILFLGPTVAAVQINEIYLK